MMSAIVNSISKPIDDNEDNWDSFIPFIQFSYNTPCLDSKEYTPFLLLHERHPRSLLDVYIDNIDISFTCRDYIIPLMENLQKTGEMAVEILNERKKGNDKKGELEDNEKQLIVGDVVCLYRPIVTPGKHRRFLRLWVEPFYIAEKLSDMHVKNSSKV